MRAQRAPAKVLTVSDGVVAGTREDRSGAALEARLVEAGYDVVERRAVVDGVESVAAALTAMTGAFTGLVVTTGGTGLKDDIIRLGEPVHIIAGTPGRILDLASKGVADLTECPIFVMDEADKLLSPEFTVVIEQLLAFHPKDRQVMLFSATFPVVVKSFKVSLVMPVLLVV